MKEYKILRGLLSSQLSELNNFKNVLQRKLIKKENSFLGVGING